MKFMNNLQFSYRCNIQYCQSLRTHFCYYFTGQVSLLRNKKKKKEENTCLRMFLMYIT